MKPAKVMSEAAEAPVLALAVALQEHSIALSL